jgi:uncharacterized membrane protein YdjX (TVP38/TMEM64 family)
VVGSIEKISKMPEPWASLTFIAFLLFYQFSFIPTQSTFIVIMSFTLNNFWHSLLLQATSTVISASVTFYLAKKMFKNCLERKYKDKVLYKVAMIESKKNPYKINIFLRIMFIPVTFKNCILPLTGTPYNIYFVGLLVAIFFFGTLYTMIGLGLKNVEEFFVPKNFGQLNVFQKVKVIMSWLIMVGTIAIFVYIYFFTKRKMREFEEQVEEEEERSKNNSKLLNESGNANE